MTDFKAVTKLYLMKTQNPPQQGGFFYLRDWLQNG